MTQMNLSMKQGYRYREHTGGCQEERVWEEAQRRRLGLHRMNKQGAGVQHENYIQYPLINHNRKEQKKKDTYTCITQPLNYSSS